MFGDRKDDFYVLYSGFYNNCSLLLFFLFGLDTLFLWRSHLKGVLVFLVLRLHDIYEEHLYENGLIPLSFGGMFETLGTGMWGGCW